MDISIQNNKYSIRRFIVTTKLNKLVLRRSLMALHSEMKVKFLVWVLQKKKVNCSKKYWPTVKTAMKEKQFLKQAAQLYIIIIITLHIIIYETYMSIS